MTEVLSANEEISIDDEAVWDAIRPGTAFKKCIESINEEPCSSDALSDVEDCPSRSSSPELEVLEVLKNKTHITVDLTLDDDDDDDDIECDTNSTKVKWDISGSSHGRNAESVIAHTSKNAPILDISDDETDSSQGGMQEEVAILSSSNTGNNSLPVVSPSVPCSAFRNDNGESYFKKPKLAWSSKFNEEDTLSLMQELESFVSLPRTIVKQESLDLSGSSGNTQLSHDSLSSASFASGFQHVSSHPQCVSTSNSQYFNSSDNHIPAVNTSYVVTSLSQPVNVSQVSFSDSSPTSSLFVTPGRISPSLCNTSAYSVPGYENTRHLDNLQNTLTTNYLPSRNHETSDLLVLSLLEADLTSDIKIPNSSSAFHTVNSGTSRLVSADCTEILSNSVLAVTPGTSDVLWNGVQPSTSTCGKDISFCSSESSRKPVSISNADVLGLGEISDTLQSGFKGPVTQSVNNVTHNGCVDGISQQGLSVANNSGLSSNALNASQYMAGSSNSDYRQWSPSDFVGTAQQSYVAPIQEIVGFVSTSQSSVINVPTPVDLSFSSSTPQPSNLAETTEAPVSVLPILSPTYILEQTSYHDESNHSAPVLRTQSQPSNIDVPKDCDHTLDSKITSKSSADIYADPPSPEGPTISCHICLDSVKTIQSSSRNLCSTVCGHIFCSDCLKASLKQKKECPMCRRKLSKKQYHPLFL